MALIFFPHCRHFSFPWSSKLLWVKTISNTLDEGVAGVAGWSGGAAARIQGVTKRWQSPSDPDHLENMGFEDSHPAVASISGRGVLGRSLNFYTFA